jgi:hypothetical protein
VPPSGAFAPAGHFSTTPFSDKLRCGYIFECMSSADRCVKCGHSQLIPDARVVCFGDGGDRDVLILKLAKRSVLRACICAKCGYTEFFIDPPDAEALHAAHLYAAEKRNRKKQ